MRKSTIWFLYFNGAFVISLSMQALEGFIAHNARHILYGHLFLDEVALPDKRRLNIACDISVNERSKFAPPTGTHHLGQYPQLPEGEDCVTRYHRLGDQDGDASKDKSSVAIGGGGTESKGGQSDGDDVGDSSMGRGQKDPPGGAIQQAMHACWAMEPDQRQLAQHSLLLAISGAIDSNPKMVDDLHEELASVTPSLGIGNMAGHWLERLHRQIKPAAVSWQQQLRRYIGKTLDSTPSLRRPSRRLPALVGIVSGRAACEAKPRILAVIDTSGSMDKQTLAAIANELRYVAKQHHVTVAEADAKVRRVYPFKRSLGAVMGRGGTDFRPALERVFLQKTHADLVVYFTDGAGPAPDKAPHIPVIWALTQPESDVPDPPAKWGKAIKVT